MMYLHTFKQITIKFQQSFYKSGKLSPQIHMVLQGLQVTKIILQKNKTGGLTVPHFETYTTLQFSRHSHQWHRINSPE